MVGRSPAERARNQALIAAERKAEERYADSPMAMQATATELRRNAAEMKDGNDRDAMIRLAAGYEQRAEEAMHRPRRPTI